MLIVVGVSVIAWENAVPDLTALRSNDTPWFAIAGLASTLFLLGYYVGPLSENARLSPSIGRPLALYMSVNIYRYDRRPSHTVESERDRSSSVRS